MSLLSIVKDTIKEYKAAALTAGLTVIVNSLDMIVTISKISGDNYHLEGNPVARDYILPNSGIPGLVAYGTAMTILECGLIFGSNYISRKLEVKNQEQGKDTLNPKLLRYMTNTTALMIALGKIYTSYLWLQYY